MTKYIVKCCPALINDDVVENGCYQRSCHHKDFFCKDRTDCKIKQIVELCKSAVDICNLLQGYFTKQRQCLRLRVLSVHVQKLKKSVLSEELNTKRTIQNKALSQIKTFFTEIFLKHAKKILKVTRFTNKHVKTSTDNTKS